MKFVKSIIFALAGVILLNSCGSKGGEADNKNPQDSSKLEGKISLSGAFALYPLANIWAAEFRKLHPDVKFNISAGGAGKGMADALAGAVDLGMLSRDIKDEEKEKGAYGIAVAKDAVLPTISAKNPHLPEIKKRGIKKEEFKGIFSDATITTWAKLLGNKSNESISVYTRSDAAGAADVWAKYVGAQGQEGLKGLGVFGDPGLAEALKNDSKGLGFNNVIYVYDINSGKKYEGIDVVPIDINGNGKIDADENFYDDLKSITGAIAAGKYPSPPARELFFVTKGKPTSPLVKEFLKWVLTDGQKFIESAGFIKLSQGKISTEAKKL